MKTEAAIIGAGPAGASAAYSLSLKGIENILIDKRETIGFPVQCAEFVSLVINQYFNLNSVPSVISQNVKFMDIDTAKNSYRFDGRGYIINRAVFDAHIVKSAVNKGTVLLKKSKVVKINFDKNRLIILNTDSKIEAEINYKYLIIATGPKNNIGLHSRFKQGLKNEAFIFATQVQADLLGSESPDFAACYFRSYIPYGYGWVFPKGRLANVGIGIEKPKAALPLSISLNLFLDELRSKGIIGRDIYGTTSGLVPVSGVNDLCFKNVALCGDAAGLTHPITGAGILSAVISGSLIGDYISESLKCSSNLLPEYKEEVESIFKKPLSAASKKRCELYPLMTDEHNIDKRIKYLWPSFEEYYE